MWFHVLNQVEVSPMLIWLLVGIAAAIALAYRQAAAALWLSAGILWLAVGYLFNAVAVPGIALATKECRSVMW